MHAFVLIPIQFFVKAKLSRSTIGELLSWHSPVHESLVGHSIRKACPTHSNILEQTEVHDLMLTSFVVELARRFRFVWFDTSNVERLLQ